MSTSQIIKAAIETAAALIDEHQEYVSNQDFNNRLDQGELEGYEIILRTPTGEQLLEPISRAIFFADPPTYQQLLRQDRKSTKSSALWLDQFPENEGVYEELLSIIKRHSTVIPFVGAGFSVAAGCPSWSNYIAAQARRAGLNEEEVQERLHAGDHERVMDEVIQEQTLPVFSRDFKHAFAGAKITPALSPSADLVDLFDGCMITTNFDEVLESCLEALGAPFREKPVGNEKSGRFIRAIYSGSNYLLKLHGGIDEPRNRVLTLDEYNAGYGASGIDYDYPIPSLLKKIFGSFSVVFMGCSLISDRYLSVLKELYGSHQEYMPRHFAILNTPRDEGERRARDQFLAGHGISPIWFPDGEWDSPSQILKLLKVEKI
ncbi:MULTISPECIES: SIR2 family protein [unclassified Pseudomonas]|uniref:SIR2 family protein n=2 Tax=Pseudomonas TaxID=286 RepID=UPI0015A223DD|nr:MULTISPECIES: SIR2 family protein [unclassified Pseudomonas]NWC95541.1 SIR2 family protein [Pseudomonas sp. IPO3779]NWD19739.1 SIR2 family protein [Pseudomonas sp. IPO3778]